MIPTERAVFTDDHAAFRDTVRRVFADVIEPRLDAHEQEGIVEREASIHASNVQLVCPECGAVSRTGRRQLDDGTRVRVCVKCKGVVDK